MCIEPARVGVWTIKKTNLTTINHGEMNLQRFGRLNQKNPDWTTKHGMTDQQYLSFSRETHGNHRQTGNLWSYHVFPVHILERLLVWSIATCQLQICYCYSWSPQMCHGPTPSYGQRLSRLPDWVCWGGPSRSHGHINPNKSIKREASFWIPNHFGSWAMKTPHCLAKNMHESSQSQFVVLKLCQKTAKSKFCWWISSIVVWICFPPTPTNKGNTLVATS